jgi:hypothetical protein
LKAMVSFYPRGASCTAALAGEDPTIEDSPPRLASQLATRRRFVSFFAFGAKQVREVRASRIRVLGRIWLFSGFAVSGEYRGRNTRWHAVVIRCRRAAAIFLGGLALLSSLPVEARASGTSLTGTAGLQATATSAVAAVETGTPAPQTKAASPTQTTPASTAVSSATQSAVADASHRAVPSSQTTSQAPAAAAPSTPAPTTKTSAPQSVSTTVTSVSKTVASAPQSVATAPASAPQSVAKTPVSAPAPAC